jgi:ankyrin repeat protein
MPAFPTRESIRWMVEEGFEISPEGVRRDWTLAERLAQGLADAAMIGDLALVEELLARGAENDVGALSDAAIYNRLEVIRCLISRGANVNSASEQGYTPLMAAAWTGRPEATRLLLACGADVRTRDLSGKTALDLARDALAEREHELPRGFETIQVLEEAERNR